MFLFYAKTQCIVDHSHRAKTMFSFLVEVQAGVLIKTKKLKSCFLLLV